MKRIITYDLKHSSPEDYLDLYKVFEELNGMQLTESTYVIDTSLSQKAIIAKIKQVIYSDDIVYYISVDDKTHKLFYLRLK